MSHAISPHPLLHALMYGATGLLFAYASVQVPLWIGLIQGRAPWSKLLVSAPVAFVLMVVVAIVTTVGKGFLWHGSELSGFIIGVGLCAVLGYVVGRSAASRRQSDTVHRRGALVSIEPPVPNRRSFWSWKWGARGKSSPNTTLTLAGLPVAPEDETKHFKLIGTTGTGKSTAIRELLSAALARGDRAVVADPDGGYLNNFYNAGRGDVILNPFDDDAAKWNLFGEIATDYDVDQLARSLIPDGVETDRSWRDYARTFFSAVTQQARAARIDDREFWSLLNEAPEKDLRVLLKGTPAGPFLERGNEKLFGSVRAITSSAVRVLDYTTRQRTTPFSVREWVRQGAPRHAGGSGGVLFFPYKAGEIAALGSVISAWMRLAIFEAMGRGEGDQRLWFVVDELDALGEIDGLKDALARLRKFGGRTILGFQSIAQVSGTYGRGAADTIVENCGNTLILRCSASEHGGTSEFASKLIGQREVTQITQSKTRVPTKLAASTTTSEHVRIEPAVMASEIEALPDLHGFLKFASTPEWRWVRLTPRMYPTVVRNRRPAATASTPAVPVAVAPTNSAADALPSAPGGPAKSTHPRRPARKRTGKRQAQKSKEHIGQTPPSNGRQETP